MAGVFLSYSHQDGATASALAAALEEAGHRVFWDRKITAGAEFERSIEAALDQADVVLVAWSKTSSRSAWVRDEAAAGRDTGRLVPITLDGSPPPLGFRQFQTIDFSRWKGRPEEPAFRHLIEALDSRAETMGGAPPANAVTPPAALAAPGGRPRRLIAAIAAALAILLAAVGGILLWPRTRVDVPPQVQLAEFKTLSPELPPDLADSLREELTAAFEVEDAVMVVEGAEKVGPKTRLAIRATIRKAEEALRFTLHLANEESGASLWSGSYDRPIASAALAPRQVAASVSQVIRCGLYGAGPYLRRMSDRQLSLWLQHCANYWSIELLPVEVLIHSARRVTEAAPDFSRGWSTLVLHLTEMVHFAPAGTVRAIEAEAAEAAERALRLDPMNSEAYAAKSTTLLPAREWAQIVSLLRKAIEVRPTDCACEHNNMGTVLTALGYFEEAMPAFRRFHAMQPLAVQGRTDLAEALFRIGRDDEGRQYLNAAAELWPDATSIGAVRLRAAFRAKRYDEAAELLADPKLALPEGTRRALAAAARALASGDAEGGIEAAALLKEVGRDRNNAERLIPIALAALGENEAALTVAERNGVWFYGVLYEPSFAEARREPAFAALAERLGFVRYWRHSKRPPDFCKAPDAPALCATL
ncbi:MAG TPA: toll/interleukin-1 receptor domain-containing protein [Allosphingosinicella sp.]|nr:toll/interleukin-1 receptor domain-containing protein [Allosphingosinicella sp.]